ncbi:hypothetical protein D3C84_790530 [compost metagenome]
MGSSSRRSARLTAAGHHWDLAVLCKKPSDMLGVSDRAGSSQGLRLTLCSVSPSAHLYSVGIPGLMISRLNGWPAVALVNASLPASRRPMHDSGPR